MNEILLKLADENIERVEWTLQDGGWQPTAGYVRKLLNAYKELRAAFPVQRQDA